MSLEYDVLFSKARKRLNFDVTKQYQIVEYLLKVLAKAVNVGANIIN